MNEDATKLQQNENTALQSEDAAHDSYFLFHVKINRNMQVKDIEESVEQQLDDLFMRLHEEGFWLSSNIKGRSKPANSGSKTSARHTGEKGKQSLIGMVKRIIVNMRQTDQSGEHEITIFRENYHVDPIYRDCYYYGYARQHHSIPRHSQRLCFFRGGTEIDQAFFDYDQGKLQQTFIGSCVLNPTGVGSIGRSLFSPKYMLGKTNDEKHSTHAYLRLADFDIAVGGIELVTKSFPFREQDAHILRCAEITLVNLVEYYSKKYKDYGFVLGSQIHEREKNYLNERTVPANGIPYAVASRLLFDFGFQPRLHFIGTGEINTNAFKRRFHHYIESGIPVAVNVATDDEKSGHSLLCIGHAEISRKRKSDLNGDTFWFGDIDVVQDNQNNPLSPIEKWNKSTKCALRFTSDFYDNYIVMDDNQLPFTERSFDKLSKHIEMENKTILVALHKGILLDAKDAEDYLIRLLSAEKTGLFNWSRNYLDTKRKQGENVEIAVRMFLASSKTLKADRVKQPEFSTTRKSIYSYTALPHFVWVAEIYLMEDYLQGIAGEKPLMAFGEVVLDATSGKNELPANSIVIWNFPEVFGNRMPDCTLSGYRKDKEPDIFEKDYLGIKPFASNLDHIDISFDELHL